jgi:hypothetical protein
VVALVRAMAVVHDRRGLVQAFGLCGSDRRPRGTRPNGSLSALLVPFNQFCPPRVGTIVTSGVC